MGEWFALWSLNAGHLAAYIFFLCPDAEMPPPCCPAVPPAAPLRLASPDLPVLLIPHLGPPGHIQDLPIAAHPWSLHVLTRLRATGGYHSTDSCSHIMINRTHIFVLGIVQFFQQFCVQERELSQEERSRGKHLLTEGNKIWGLRFSACD